MVQNKPTTDEHFISQFYLKGFSPDRNRVYQYDMLNWKAYPLILTRKICFEKNLYEFTDSNGSFVFRNTIENLLCEYEKVFSKVFASIISKTKDNRNFRTRTFLTTKEKGLLIAYMTIQILRMPYFIKTGEDVAIETCKEILPYQARNLSIISSLPIYKKFDENEKNLFFYVVQWFEDMAFIILKSESHNIFTGDNPIYFYGKDKYSNDVNVKPEKVIFPLTSNLVLYMLPINKVRPDLKNRLLPIQDEQIKEVHQSIAAISNRWLYSYSPLTEKEVKLIKKARQKRS